MTTRPPRRRRLREPRTSPRRLAATERQRRALELRRHRFTFKAIAAELGYAHPRAAQAAVEAGLKATLREPADLLRALEGERLDAMHAALWPMALAGDLKAADAVLKIMDRRARLFGLYKS